MPQTQKAEKNGSNGAHPMIKGQASSSPPSLTADEDRLMTWLRVFNGFHRRRPGRIPVLIKSVEVRDAGPDGEPTLRRYVWEICKEYSRRGVKWTFITWAIDARGMTFADCADYAAAVALFERPPTAEHPPCAHGVFLRPGYAEAC